MVNEPDDARRAEIAEHYGRLADSEFDGYCPLYAAIARSITTDDDLLGSIAALPGPAKVIPVLFLAAVHDLLLAHPDEPLASVYRGERDHDPCGLFRSLVLEHIDELATTVATRAVQTNEVGRTAPVLVALTKIHHDLGRPLALIEIGASAGLNLLVDHYTYDFVPDDQHDRDDRSDQDGHAREAAPVEVGPRASTVRLTCAIRGPHRPPVAAPPPIAMRIGIDPRPVDVRDARERRWLAACLWPLVPDRPQRLAAALAIARRDPPLIRRGRALDLLGAVIAQVPDDVVPVIVSTWVLAYFDQAERLDLHDLLALIGARRDVALITGEYQGIVPWLPSPDGAAKPTRATNRSATRSTILGITTWFGGREQATTVARMHAHGQWIEWLEQRSPPCA